MLLFRFLLGIAAVVALVLLYFFVIGLADGSVSSFNILLWLALLGGTAAVLGGSWILNAKGQRGAASAILAVLAIPGLLFGLFFLLLIVLQPNWH